MAYKRVEFRTKGGKKVSFRARVKGRVAKGGPQGRVKGQKRVKDRPKRAKRKSTRVGRNDFLVTRW